jgi:hypothetical protein
LKVLLTIRNSLIAQRNLEQRIWTEGGEERGNGKVYIVERSHDCHLRNK